MQQEKITIDSIKAKLKACLQEVDSIEIIDDSEAHSGHAAMRALDQKPELSHIRINIVSDSFKCLKPLERHRLVQDLLEEEYRAIHSISLKLGVKSE